MKMKAVWKSKVLMAAMAVAASLSIALAGPPLICHAFSIGDAKSLPWGTAEKGWFTPRGDYDTRYLVDDTLALLTGQTPVIVRMETIRRATLYCFKDPSLSRALLDRFRTLADERGGRGALRLFDYGYLIETMKQGAVTNQLQSVSGAVSGMSGYPLIQEALQLRGNDPEMEFAAAIVTVWPKNDRHQEHFRKAVSGAAGDPLLATNLLERFPDRGKTLAELHAY